MATLPRVPQEVARTGLVVRVPEAEPVVGPHRLRLDASAALGAPAHVTVLFPFAPADRIDDHVLSRVANTLRTVPGFAYRFSRTAWFDDRVLYLAPDDDAPFRRLTDRVHAEVPEFPPFEGLFDDVVPHLTVGQDQPVEVLKQAEDDVRAHLPIEGDATDVLLLVQDEPGGRWRRGARFPLSRR
jgi:2'-5' RNA ligase